MIKAKVNVGTQVKRGSESWAYFHTTLGFVLTIEAAIIAMITQLWFPLNIIFYAFVVCLTFRVFTRSRWLHNKLIGFKNANEESLL